MRFLTLFLVVTLTSQLAKSQAIITIGSKQSKTRYYQAANGSITFPVEITLRYNGTDVNEPQTVKFAIVNSTNTAIISNAAIEQTVVIDPAEFSRTIKEKTARLNITLNAVSSLEKDELFDIEITGSGPNDPRHRVIIENIPVGQSVSTAQINQVMTDTIYEAPLERDAASSDLRSKWLRYEVTGTLDKDSTVELELQGNSGNSVTTELETKTFRVPRSRTLNGKYIDSVKVYYRVNSVKSFGQDESVFLKIKDGNPRDKIVFSRRLLTHSNKPFWIEIGSNFDLLDGIKPNNLFAGVFLYKRDIGSLWTEEYTKVKTYWKKSNDQPVDGLVLYDKEQLKGKYIKPEREQNISIMAGIYQSRSISSENTSSLVEYQDNRSLMPDTNGRYMIFKDTGSISQSTTINNLGLFFSPQLRYTRGSANMDGLHAFVSLWIEILWQKTETVYDYTQTSNFQTVHVSPDSMYLYQHKKTKSLLDYRTQYYGVGAPVFLKEGDINLFFNPVIGITNQKFQLARGADNPTLQELKGMPATPVEYVTGWSTFYLTTFRLSEEKYGISFTGEVRGLINRKAKPIISLALSKKFDLSKLLEYK